VLGKPTTPLEVTLSLLSPLKRRRYSISSSRGVSSTYLAGVEAGQVVKVAVAFSGGFQAPASRPSAATPSTVPPSVRRATYSARRSSLPSAGEAMRTGPTSTSGRPTSAMASTRSSGRFPARIDELLSRGAIIYVCGDASGMAAGVRASFGDDVVGDLRSRGQYMEDVWSSTFSHA